ncbi:MAG: hypothetical protein BWK80_42815 [Desulfobacteraceae bacterium IS3]|nr:MAG: hypothetical protein BWK80_42815 [Desulfobacteraceae bacterium IS3]
MLKNQIKQEILKKLTDHVNLYKVILFGSYAYGNPVTDSDIDLIVVTDDDYIPNTYAENMRNYLRVSSAIRDIKKSIPIDLIVHTRPMYDKFVQMGSMFSKEVLKKGEILYEKNNRGMA